MQKLNTLLFALICIMADAFPLIAMKKGSQPTSPVKRGRENSEMIDLTNLNLQSPEKKTNNTRNHTVTRAMRRLRYEQADAVGAELPTFIPVETEEIVAVKVSPLAKAVYEDDVETLNCILNTQDHDLLCLTPNIIDCTEAATLLDIAANRGSYKCLEYFQGLFDMPRPRHSLVMQAARAIYLSNMPGLLEKAQLRCPDLDIKAVAEHSHLYHKVVPNLLNLYTVSQQSSLRIARRTGDIRCGMLLSYPKG